MQGAVLILPDGGDCYDSEHPLIFEDYAVTNAHSWYKYLNGQGREIRNGMLYLVTGCDKCHTWGSACHSHLALSNGVSLKFTATGGTEASRALRYSWEAQTDSGIHQHSHHCDVTPQAIANQTVFLRGYSISVGKYPLLCVKLGLKTVETFKSALRGSRLPPISGSRVPYTSQRSSMAPAATRMELLGATQVSLLFSYYRS